LITGCGTSRAAPASSTTGKIREYKIVAGKSNVGQVACNSIVRLVVPHLEGFTGGHIRLHD